jgi:hypothetical protein
LVRPGEPGEEALRRPEREGGPRPLVIDAHCARRSRRPRGHLPPRRSYAAGFSSCGAVAQQARS